MRSSASGAAASWPPAGTFSQRAVDLRRPDRMAKEGAVVDAIACRELVHLRHREPSAGGGVGQLVDALGDTLRSFSWFSKTLPVMASRSAPRPLPGARLTVGRHRVVGL